MKRAILWAVIFQVFTSIGVDAAFYRTQIYFSNRFPTLEEPIKMPDGTGPGERCRAQLVRVLVDGSVEAICRIGRFRTTAEWARFYVVPIEVTLERYYFASERAKEGVIRLRLRVWEGDAWETARVRGESADWEQIVHPINSPYVSPATPQMPVKFRGFTLKERP